MHNIQEKEKSLEMEIENEINKMSLEELLYLELNPNQYIYNKLRPQIENIKKLENEVNTMKDEFDLLKFQKSDADNSLKEQYQKNYADITKLLEIRKSLDSKIPKNEFIKILNAQIKNFDNPDTCYNNFKEGIIDYNEFKKRFSQLGIDKNYYYYKLIYDKINS